MDIITLHPHLEESDFNTAKQLAEREAGIRLEDPMLLAWFDRDADRFSPQVTCCGNDDEPAWVIYARNRGGRLRVDIDDGRYVFLFA